MSPVQTVKQRRLIVIFQVHREDPDILRHLPDTNHNKPLDLLFYIPAMVPHMDVFCA